MPRKPPVPGGDLAERGSEPSAAAPPERPTGRPGVVRTLLVYLAMVATTLVAFLLVRSLGESRLGPAGAATLAARAEHGNRLGEGDSPVLLPEPSKTGKIPAVPRRWRSLALTFCGTCCWPWRP